MGRCLVFRSWRVLALVLLGVSSWDCSGNPPRPLRIAHEAPLASLDPVKATDSIAKSVLSNFYDALVDHDDAMRPIPGLALSWSSPDDHTWLLPLRANVATHDGGSLSPEDVRLSLERARTAPESAFKERLDTVESVSLVEGTTLRIRTSLPDPILLERLADIMVAPARAFATLETRPVGTGSYAWRETKEDAIEGTAFPSCWRGAPTIERVRFLRVNASQGVDLLAKGQVDVMRWVPEAQLSAVRSAPGIRVVERHGLRALYLWMRSAPERGSLVPFADSRVRRAVSLAIDREALVARLGGGAMPLRRFFPPGVIGYSPAQSDLVYSPAEARRLLAEAGYKTGFSTDLVFAPGAEAIIAIVAPMLRAVGIQATPKALVWTEMLPQWQAGQLPLFLGTWWFSSGDASMFLKECLRTRPEGSRTSWNPGYSDPRLDQLIAEDFTIFGSPARVRHSEALMTYLLDQMPLVPLVNRADLYAVRSPVQWKPRLDGRLLAAEMKVP